MDGYGTTIYVEVFVIAKGKIIKALSGFYYVKAEDGKVYQCRGRGVFRKRKISPLVGDYIEFQSDNEYEGYVLEVFARKNELIRPPISNIDQAILVFSAVEPMFSPQLLDRFLVVIEAAKIEPIICVTKIDLMSQAEAEQVNKFIELYKEIGYTIIQLSSETNEGIQHVTPLLEEKITVFAGQSGVGKSSLLNAIRPDLQLKTAEISTHLGRGKHTTRHVELIEVAGGLVADTPGFSSLEFTDIEAVDLTSYFIEFAQASVGCKFRGCLHLNEPGCAVKEKLANGEIAKSRYTNYETFMQEIKERKPRY